MNLTRNLISTLILLIFCATIYAQEPIIAPIDDEPIDCMVTIFPGGSINVGRNSGSFTLEVIADDPECHWYLRKNASWITSSVVSGTGSKTITINYTKNNLTIQRIATLQIGTGILQVIQQADCGEFVPQTSLTISSAINDEDCRIYNGVIQARDLVNLKSNFSYSAETNAPLTIKANPNLVVEADYLYAPTDATTRNVKTTGASVGSIPGNAGVSPMGAATYNIPIEIPQGIQGLHPNISITYNSEAGITLLGKGFSLAGLSSITRTGKHHYFDNGQVSGISSSDNDRFVLDGNRLLVVDGSYGALDSEYRTEQNSFNKITYVNGANGKYFKVETKDGSTIEYGNTNDSRLSLLNNTYPLAYNINQITDKNGNYIKFLYEQEDGVIRIKRIDYTGNVGFAPQHSITFYYDKRDDEKTGYIIGKKFVQNNILREIVSKTNDKIYRKYKFKYAKDKINESILSEIVLSNKAGEELNSTVFEWGDYNNSIAVNSFFPQIISDVNLKDVSFYSTDMNLDGLSDLVYFYEKGGYLYLTLYYSHSDNQGHITFRASDVLTLILGRKNSGEFINEIHPFWGDFGGTGINYMVFPRYSVYDGKIDKVNFQFATTYGSEIGADPTIDIANGEMPLIAQTDFNSDGKSELFILEKEDTNGEYKGAILRLVSGGGQINNDYAFNLSESPRAMMTGDYNNDGLTDLRIITKRKIYTFKNVNGSIDDSNYTVTDFSNIQCNKAHNGDFNGDGAIDVLIVGENDEPVAVAYGNGNFGVTIKYYSSIMGIVDPDTGKDDNQDNVMVMDFNYDGLSDFILFDGVFRLEDDIWSSPWKEFDEFNVYWYQSTGSGFVLKKKTTSTNQDHAYMKYYVEGDFNGDGRQDLFNYGYDILNESGFFTMGHIYNSFNNNFEANKVISIHNGFNHKTEFKYRPLSYGENSSGADYYKIPEVTISYHPMNKYQVPFYAVEKLTTPDGKGGVVNTNYFYESLRIYKYGKGILGFEKVTAYNDKTGVSVISTNEINETYFVPKKTTTVVKLGEQTISSSENIFSQRTYDENPKLIFNYVYQSESKDELLGTSVVKSDIGYDEWGNLTKYKEQYKTGGNIDGELKVSNLYTQKGAWCMSRLRKSTVTTKYKTEDDDVKVSTYNYDDDGNLKLSTVNGVTVTIDEYDTFGNITKQTTSGVPNENSTVLYSYDASKRYVNSITNQELNQTSNSIYNDLGQLVSETGVDGLTTNYSYDNWGKLVKTVLPNSKIVETELKWETGSDYTYSITEKPEGFPETKTYFDSFGRDLKSETTGFGNKKMISEAEYNSKGQLVKTISPYFETEDKTDHITSYGYDNYGRTTSVTSNGLTTETIYTIGENQVEERYPSGKSKIAYNNATGKTYKITNNGVNLDYHYWSNGQIKDISVPGATVGLKYDTYGNRDILTDQNAGSYDFDYDVYGRLTHKASPIGTYTATYENGRLKTEDDEENAISYTYIEKGNGINQIDKVIANGVEFQDLDYDEFGRVTKLTEQVGDKKMVATYNYDIYGRQTAINYPEGFGIKYVYDPTTGDLVKITTNSDELIWQLEDINSYGQILRFKTGNESNQLETVYSYDEYNILNGINTGNKTVQDITYDFDEREGTLNFRKGLIKDIQETFTYDNLNQLEGVSSSMSSLNLDMTYSSGVTGRMESKSDVGTFQYNSSRPHAITKIDPGVTGYSPVNTDTIIYTSFGKVKRIEQGNYIVEFTYGPNHQRKVMEVYQNDALKRKVYYFGNYERHEVNGLVSHIYYLFSPTGLTAVYKKDEGTSGEMYYIHKDHLGSIHAVTNQNQTVVARYHYNVWGVKRNLNAAGNGFSEINNLPWLHRGFTGHEHITEIGLINMNGRVYDPDLGMFISPDPRLQAPEEPINFNRYAYVLNNPLVYTDPTGEFWDQIIVGVIGFGYGYVSHGIETDDWGWDAVISGAVNAAAFLYGYNTADIQGAASIMGALEYGATSVATDIISSQIPSMTVPIGDDFNISLSPSIMTGNGGYNIGVNFTATAALGDFNFGISSGFGYGKSEFTGITGSETRLSGYVGYNAENFGIGLSSNQFWSGKTSQRTGRLSLAYSDFSMSYENDGTPFQYMRIAGGTDSYRTASVTMGYRDFSIGMLLFTGHRDYNAVDYSDPVNYPYGKVSNPEIKDYNAGILYATYGNKRIGWNNDAIRHTFQNKFAHSPHKIGPINFLYGQAWIPRQDTNQPYYVIGTNNPYTNW